MTEVSCHDDKSDSESDEEEEKKAIRSVVKVLIVAVVTNVCIVFSGNLVLSVLLGKDVSTYQT